MKYIILAILFYVLGVLTMDYFNMQEAIDLRQCLNGATEKSN